MIADASKHWPIARLTVTADGRIAGASFYSPGLPPGVHDVWCVPVLEAAVAAERERCAKLCEAARPAGGRQWDEAQAACYEALTHVAEYIRTGKPT